MFYPSNPIKGLLMTTTVTVPPTREGAARFDETHYRVGEILYIDLGDFGLYSSLSHVNVRRSTDMSDARPLDMSSIPFACELDTEPEDHYALVKIPDGTGLWDIVFQRLDNPSHPTEYHWYHPGSQVGCTWEKLQQLREPSPVERG